MSGNEAFELVGERGWRRGLSNMVNSGFSRWFKTRMWWIQCLIWGAMVGGILAAVAYNPEPPPNDELLSLFTVFAGLFPAVGVIIIMQDALVGEKRDGTAAWVLSKPLTRSSFILSKIIPNGAGILLTMVVVPAILAYFIFMSKGVGLNLLGYIEAMGIIFISHFYFLAMTLMLGTLFSNRGPVIGLPLAVLFLQQNLIGVFPALRYILPWTLVLPVGNSPSLASALMIGAPIQRDFLITLGIILGEIVLFVLIGMWRFDREEF